MVPAATAMVSVLEETVRGWTEGGARGGLLGTLIKTQYDEFRNKKA